MADRLIHSHAPRAFWWCWPRAVAQVALWYDEAASARDHFAGLLHACCIRNRLALERTHDLAERDRVLDDIVAASHRQSRALMPSVWAQLQGVCTARTCARAHAHLLSSRGLRGPIPLNKSPLCDDGTRACLNIVSTRHNLA